jgi:hypothetical protein
MPQASLSGLAQSNLQTQWMQPFEADGLVCPERRRGVARRRFGAGPRVPSRQRRWDHAAADQPYGGGDNTFISGLGSLPSGEVFVGGQARVDGTPLDTPDTEYDFVVRKLRAD